jgi:hypothetical protein
VDVVCTTCITFKYLHFDDVRIYVFSYDCLLGWQLWPAMKQSLTARNKQRLGDAQPQALRKILVIICISVAGVDDASND